MSQLDLVWRGYVGDRSPEPEPSLAGLRLITPIREATWLGREPDGRSVTASRLTDLLDPVNLAGSADAADPAMCSAGLTDRAAADRAAADRAAVLASLRAPSLVRVLGVQRVNGALWVVSELDDGVRLSRLLELTRPRPAQAVAVGLGVLCGLGTVHAAGYAHGGICAGEVRVGSDGRVRLDGWVAGALSGTLCRSAPLEQRQRADLAAAGGLLSHLAGAARRCPAAADEGALELLAALDTAAGRAAHPGADIGLMAAALEAACGPDEDAAARSELAALVRAATASGSAAQRSRRPQPGAAAAGSAVQTLTDPRRLALLLRGLWKRMWTWVVALTVLVAVVSVEFALLHERLAQDLRLLREGGGQGQGAAAPAEPTPVKLPPVPRPAPASAGAVDGVDLRALEPCTPGAVCAVRVLVQLDSQLPLVAQQPPPPSRTVEWTFLVVDRCTGSQYSAAGGAVSAAPGGDRVQAVSTVSLPPGDALALIAVTNEPATAASGPLLVPAREGSCPRN